MAPRKGAALRGDGLAAGTPAAQAEPPTGTGPQTQAWRLEPMAPRGEAKAFDTDRHGGAPRRRCHRQGPGGGDGVFKQTLDAGGELFEAAAKGIADPRAPYVRFDGLRGQEFIRFSQRYGIEVGPEISDIN
ncbi:hypothetical protein AB0A98_22595 [Streptomyces chrestomyceticus]|uniref:hypothetical protein n=1 Tax=Streptomyces chrestomyceticus TaxID=68185 RepID=UPI0033F8E648